MRIKRMAVLGVSAVCILAVLVSIRGNSSIPVDHPSHEDPLLSTDLHQDPELSNIVELHIDVSLDESSFEVLEALNENFMKQHPDIKVNLRNYTGDVLYDVLARAFRLGDPADIILLDNDKVLSYASKARLKPTDDFYTSEPTAEYVPMMMEQLKWNGYIWAIPYQVQPYVLSYHQQSWFELTGDVRPYTAEDVWQVWREGGLLLDTEDPYTFAAFLGSLVDSWQFGSLADASEEEDVAEDADDPDEDLSELSEDEIADDQSASESEETAELMSVEATVMMNGDVTEYDSVNTMNTELIDQEEMNRLTAAQISHVNLDSAEKWAMLAQGEIVAAVVPLAEYVAHESDDIAITLLPNYEGDGTALLTGRSFVLTAESKHQDAAYRWIHEMTTSLHELDNREIERMSDAYPANQAAYEHPTLRRLSIYRILHHAIDKGQALAPDPNLDRKLSIVRDTFILDAISEAWSEPTDLMSQIVEKYAASGF